MNTRKKRRAYLARYPKRSSEKDFFDALQSPKLETPGWFVSVRRATPEEDGMGFDAFVLTTDMGEIPVQLKSSRGGASKYRQHRPESPAVILIVHRRARPSKVHTKFFAELAEQRLMRQLGQRG